MAADTNSLISIVLFD